MKKIKVLPILLALMMLFSFFAFPACNNATNNNDNKTDATVRVMVEQGVHYQVIGDAVKDVKIGEDATFPISIDEGYYYVSNNSGATFADNQLILKNVMMPRTIKIEVKAYTYTVKLNETEGLKVHEGETFVQKAVSLEVTHGEDAVFDVEIDEGYEYYQNTVSSIDENNQPAVYEDGKLTVENVCCDKEIFVQLRQKVVVEQEKVTVKLTENEAFTIKGESEQVVESGTDVEFEITVKEKYYYVSNNCGAEYNAETGKIIFRNARANQTIQLVFRKHGVNVTDYPNGVVESVVDGDDILFTAIPNATYVFTGWYYTKEVEVGEGEVIEEEIFYSYANNLKLSSFEAENLKLKPIFSWKAIHKVVTYHANGGKIYGSEDETIVDAFNHDVYLYQAALGEWCFNTFYREGYVPIEYNTKADGSGEAISLGSRIFNDSKSVDLYVIWEEENKATDFTYTYLDENDKAAGIELVKYTGKDLSVVIPNEIEQSPVKVIGSACFEGQSIESVVLTRNVVEIKQGAFKNCHALETVYMCDSVEIVSDESFANCSALANLRMMAALPPVYSDHLIGATIRRFELLYNAKNDWTTNILFYGGSSTFQGIDGATLSKLLGSSQYRIINCAQNAYISGPLMLELYSHFMKEKDIMVFMPEYSPQAYSSCLELPSWIAVEAFYDAFRYIDLRNYSNVFDAFYDIQHGSENYQYVGKLQQIKDRKNLSYYNYDDTFDQYFTRAENFKITKVELKTLDAPSFEEFKTSVLNDINPLYEKRYKGKLTMYFACFAFWEKAYDPSTQHAAYEQWLKENVAFPYISDYRNHLYAEEYISDSVSHLTREGAILHSEVIAAELRAQLGLD